MIITRLSDHAGDFHMSGANVSRESCNSQLGADC